MVDALSRYQARREQLSRVDFPRTARSRPLETFSVGPGDWEAREWTRPFKG